MGREMSQLGADVPRRNLNVRPTIKVPGGVPVQRAREPRHAVRPAVRAAKKCMVLPDLAVASVDHLLIAAVASRDCFNVNKCSCR